MSALSRDDHMLVTHPPQSGQLVAVKQINIRNTGGKLSVGKKEIDILKVHCHPFIHLSVTLPSFGNLPVCVLV